jgi:hypothetical protein
MEKSCTNTEEKNHYFAWCPQLYKHYPKKCKNDYTHFCISFMGILNIPISSGRSLLAFSLVNITSFSGKGRVVHKRKICTQMKEFCTNEEVMAQTKELCVNGQVAHKWRTGTQLVVGRVVHEHWEENFIRPEKY